MATVKENIATWKKLKTCKSRFVAAKKAFAWVTATGNFSVPPAPLKDFATAMSVDATHTLEAAFSSDILIGIICQESSFGTVLGTSPEYKGPYQLAEIVCTDYNNNNSAHKVTFPGDIDELADLEKATRVAAWFYAVNIQRLTKKSAGLSAVTDAAEAKNFALASYNGGASVIKKAREKAAAGGDSDTWKKVKDRLEEAGVDKVKANEIRAYVKNVLEYADESGACWCDDCEGI